MARDDRDILDIFKFELDFVENGGYARPARTQWNRPSTFEDSLTCINFGDSLKSRPCDECLLIEFVPEAQRTALLPCHHIPLAESGITVDLLEQKKDHPALESALKAWLRKKIAEVESARVRSSIH